MRQTKSRNIIVRVSDYEHRLINAMAEKANLSLSAYVRLCATVATIEMPDLQSSEAAMHEKASSTYGKMATSVGNKDVKEGYEELSRLEKEHADKLRQFSKRMFNPKQKRGTT